MSQIGSDKDMQSIIDKLLGMRVDAANCREHGRLADDVACLLKKCAGRRIASIKFHSNSLTDDVEELSFERSGNCYDPRLSMCSQITLDVLLSDAIIKEIERSIVIDSEKKQKKPGAEVSVRIRKIKELLGV